MKVVCRNCAHIGESERKLKGHGLITFILLLCWLVPGIIYMIWRRTGLKDTCSKCGSENIVDAQSSAGSAALYEIPTPETHVKCPDCKELVRMDATKCKHCGTVLVPQEPVRLPAPPSNAEAIGRKLGSFFAAKK